MPLGVIIARYLKVFKSADPAWFYLHIACQTSAYVVGVAGWATGMKLGSEASIHNYPHRNIGITLFCLGTLQVLHYFIHTWTLTPCLWDEIINLDHLNYLVSYYEAIYQQFNVLSSLSLNSIQLILIMFVFLLTGSASKVFWTWLNHLKRVTFTKAISTTQFPFLHTS